MENKEIISYITDISRLINGEAAGSFRRISTACPSLQRLHSNQGGDKVIDPDEPMKFFGSEAATWKAEQTRSGQNSKDTLWYQPYVIMGSLLVFMVYFCVLREESDVDGELGKSLYDRVDGLEEIQLKIVHKYNLENEVDNSRIEDRMKELNISIPKY